jgi:transitional endoplasmic reticulum ATPase
MSLTLCQSYSKKSSFRGPQEPGQFPFAYQLGLYTERVLGHISLTQVMLACVFALLTKKDQITALRLVRRQAAIKLKKRNTQLPGLSVSINKMDGDDIAGKIHCCLSMCKSTAIITKLEAHLKSCITRERAEIAGIEGPASCERMADLQRLFGLTDDELSLLAVTLCYSASRDLETLCDFICVQEKREFIALLTGMSMQRLAIVTGRKARLVRAGILEVPSHWTNGSFYKLAPDIREHLLGMGETSLALKFAAPAGAARFATECFGLPAEAVRIVTGLLRSTSPCSILLHGVPGTGKTEFAKSLAAACGKQAYLVSHSTTDGLQNGRVAIEAVAAAYQSSEYLVVVDEADEILNLQGSSFGFLSGGQSKNSLAGKSWLNDFLDRCQTQIVWITNEIDSIDESSMRRFAYNIPFRRQSARRRQEIWQSHLQESVLQPLVSAEDVADMARKFRVGAAGIANALANTARIVPVGCTDKTAVLGTLRELLASHERLTGGGSDGKLMDLASQYDPGAVCTDVSAEGIVACLKSCQASQCGERSGVNLLFWGPPGTGKTAFAQYLAQSLDKELIIRRASDLLNKYVGGTEHNIREAFEQAHHEDAILLLDEADSFFIDRSRAHHSWETTQTNELLTQMENHRGILLCCTNLLEYLDHAVLRRFAWKVQFKMPTPEGRQRLYRRYFDVQENPAPKDCLDRVARIENISPGVMKAVWVRYRFRPAAEWNHSEIVQTLSDEVAYRGQKHAVMGFHGKALS